MKGQITLTLDNNTLGTIDADDHPDLFVGLISVLRGGARVEIDRDDFRSPKGDKKVTKTKVDGGTKMTTKFETRTPGGRNALDAVVLDALGAIGGWVRVEKLSIPVTGAQIRSSLHRLVDSGVVKRRGQARATEYTTDEKGSAPAPEGKSTPKTKAKKKAPPKPAAKKGGKKPARKKAPKKGKGK